MMRMCTWLSALLLCAVLASSAAAPKKKTSATQPPAKKVTVADVAPDLDQRLARYKVVPMPFHSAALTARERQLVKKLVEASRPLETIYWLQNDPQGLELYQSLAGAADPQQRKLRQYLKINASRFDLIDEDRPFVGTEPAPPGRGFYPAGITREEIEKYVKAHPEKRAEIYSPITVVRRVENGDLIGVPYHTAYKSFLAPASKALRAAADLSGDPRFADFLRLRAAALLNDDYYKSDLAWLDLEAPKFDVIFAPYETYTDGLLGVKTSYGAAVMVRNETQSRKLAVYQKYVPDLQDALPLEAEDRPSKRGHASPMEVMDTPFRAGDLNHGYQAVADNLPNDPRIHQEKGSKKLFFKNFMDARVHYVVLPIARKLMRADQAARASGEGYLAAVLMHEISHGLGPAYARKADLQMDIRESIGPVYSALEEAKADVVGMWGLNWLVEHGALPRERLPAYYDSYVAGIFRTVRFGTAEAHGRAEMMEFNFLSEKKAITRDPATGRYMVHDERMAGALAALAKELLTIEATGDRERAEGWFQRYDSMPADLQSALESVRGVPVDIAPRFAFPETIR